LLRIAAEMPASNRYTGGVKTFTITEAKRKLSRLATSQEPVQLTMRGQPIGQLRVYAEPKRDPEAARAAFDRLKRLAATRKPSKKHGATRAVRELRDRGE
jgi:hypothetical protein